NRRQGPTISGPFHRTYSRARAPVPVRARPDARRREPERYVPVWTWRLEAKQSQLRFCGRGGLVPNLAGETRGAFGRVAKGQHIFRDGFCYDRSVGDDAVLADANSFENFDI